FCSHFRALYLMVESINSYGFVSYSDTLVPCTPDLVLGSTTYMGENCPSNSSSPRYTLCTSSTIVSLATNCADVGGISQDDVKLWLSDRTRSLVSVDLNIRFN
ncbi:hypothetical protein ILUMI_13418, partial [Ignelater luminosus]